MVMFQERYPSGRILVAFCGILDKLSVFCRINIHDMVSKFDSSLPDIASRIELE